MIIPNSPIKNYFSADHSFLLSLNLNKIFNRRKMFFRLLKEGFLFAVNSFAVNKLRTFLSLFGITIGIFSIISVFTVLDWMEKSIRDSISTLGDNVVYVQKFPWSFDPNLAWWDIIKWPAVSIKDYDAILNRSTKTEAACFSAYQPESIRYRKNQDNDYRGIQEGRERRNDRQRT